MEYDENIVFKKDGIELRGSCNSEFIRLVDIIDECNKARIKEDKLGLMEIEWKYARNFDGAFEQFVGPIEDLKRIKEIIVGKEIYFGEIAGKHSEIYGNLEENEINIIEEPEEINNFLKEYPTGHEYNHSFLCTFQDGILDERYDDITEEVGKEFMKLRSWKINEN